MTNGSAIIHINGKEYHLADKFSDENSPEFQDLTARIERLISDPGGQVQHFNVLIGGYKSSLLVRPGALVSAAAVFVR